MIETKQVNQQPGEHHKRWFSDDYFDLIVWENGNGDIVRFELCYGKQKDEHAFVWDQETGHAHLKVDDGEGAPGRYKRSPLLIADGIFKGEAIAAQFLEAGKAIDRKIATFVYSKLTDLNQRAFKG